MPSQERTADTALPLHITSPNNAQTLDTHQASTTFFTEPDAQTLLRLLPNDILHNQAQHRKTKHESHKHLHRRTAKQSYLSLHLHHTNPPKAKPNHRSPLPTQANNSNTTMLESTEPIQPSQSLNRPQRGPSYTPQDPRLEDSMTYMNMTEPTPTEHIHVHPST